MLEQTESLLGVRRSRVRSTATDLAAAHKVSVEEQKLVITNLIETAKKYIRQAETDPDLSLVERLRKYELALEQLERAKERLQWMPVGEQPAGIDAQLRELIGTTDTRAKTTGEYKKIRAREDARRR